jgi:hypothetical protein
METSLHIDVPSYNCRSESPPPRAHRILSPGAYTSALMGVVNPGGIGPVSWVQAVGFPRLSEDPATMIGSAASKSAGSVLICFGFGVGFALP